MKKIDMTKGNLWKQILIYSLPLVFSNLLQLLFNISDVAIVGQFAGPISLGAVGSTTLLVSLTTGWLIGISNGVNSVVAYFSGANDKKNESDAIHTGFILCFVFGILTFLIGFYLAKPVLTVMGTKEDLLDEAILYFKIYMAGSPALALFNYGNSVLSAEGNTKKPLIYLTVSGILNVALNLFFVLVLHMTSDGVAYASIISQYFSAVLILVAMVRSKEDYRLTPKKLCLSPDISRHILRIGLPAALQYSLFALANLVVQSAVNSFDSVVVEGNSAAMNFDSIVYEMMAAFYVASTSFIAHNYGAGNKKRVKQTYLVTTVYSFLLAVVFGLLIHFFRYPLLGIFTTDKEVIAKGAIRLGILSLTYSLSAFMDNATAAARGLGKTAIPTVIVLMGTIVFRLLWICTVFAHFHTLPSLYIMYGCAFVLTGILQNIYYFRIYRKIFSVNNEVK